MRPLGSFYFFSDEVSERIPPPKPSKIMNIMQGCSRLPPFAPPYHIIRPDRPYMCVESKFFHFSVKFVAQAQVTGNRCAEWKLLVFLLSFQRVGVGHPICLSQTLCAFVTCTVFQPQQYLPISIQMLSFLFLRGISDWGGKEPQPPFLYAKLFLSCLFPVCGLHMALWDLGWFSYLTIASYDFSV